MSTVRKHGDGAALPKGWRVVRLDEIADVIGGSTPPRDRSEFWSGPIPWVVPSEITSLSGRYLTSTNESITETGLQSAGLKTLPTGSVLLTSRATIGAAAISTYPVATNQGFQNLVAKEGTDSLWLYYCISSMKRELERRAAGSTFAEISRDNVRSLPVLIPPLPEQRAIADVLDSIDEAIERTEAVIAATETLRDSLLHELLTRGVPGWHTEWKDVPGIGTIPADWQVVRLDQIVDVVGGSTPSRVETEFWGGSIPWTVPSELTNLPGRYLSATNETITDAGMRSAGLQLLPAGSVLLTSRATIGAVAINLVPVVTNQGFQNLVVKDGTDNLWLYYCISSRRRELERRAAGSTFLEISRDSVRSLPVALPPFAEQEAISATLDCVDSTIGVATAERDALCSHKESTANVLLTGQERITILEDRVDQFE